MKIVFIGCGNMGTAIIRSLLTNNLFLRSEIDVILPLDSVNREIVSKELKLKIHHEHPKGTEYTVYIFAVKPQTLSEILPYYSEIIRGGLIVSIAAGKKLEFFAKYFKQNPIVRVMPNINITVNHGASVAVSTGNISFTQRFLVEKIFGASGYFNWVDEEELMDVVVATSASSPAYYFLFTKLLAQLGVEHGLPEDLALKLAENTFIGSAIMKQKSDKTLTELEQMVTSKKGTTAAALNKLKPSLYNALKEGFVAALERSKELSN